MNGQRELVFMVRMWAQAEGDRALGEWRGSIYEVESGARFYVTSSRDVADFISARMARCEKPHDSPRED